MLKDERKEAIMALLEQNKYQSVDELVSALHYSPATIRRDIRALVCAGKAKKSYGGIALDTSDKPMVVRAHEFSTEKGTLAKRGSTLVGDGDTVFIAGSSTTAHLLRPLCEKKGLTVVTNDPTLALSFEERGVRTYVTGGSLQGGMLTGPLATASVAAFSFDALFFSVTGISETGALSVHSEAFASLLSALFSRAEKRVCLAVDAKHGARAPFAVGDLSAVTHLVGNTPPAATLAARYPGTVFLSTEK